MIQIPYLPAILFVTFGWILVRGVVCAGQKRIDWKRELELLPVYICIVVVVRFTFFPFDKIDGKIQPLNFDAAQLKSPHINMIPVVNMLNYETTGEMLINVIGNTAMFIPLGVIWPVVFKKLDTHAKVVAAGVGFSLCIEILQLLFFERVTDINDLILNSVGFAVGYGLYLLVKTMKNHRSSHV